MSLYTLTQAAQLISSPGQALAAIAGGPGGTQLAQGDIVTVADPAQTAAGFTQVTTASGQVGWVPTNAISAGVVGSTAMNVGLLAAAAVGIWFFFFRK